MRRPSYLPMGIGATALATVIGISCGCRPGRTEPAPAPAVSVDAGVVQAAALPIENTPPPAPVVAAPTDGGVVDGAASAPAVVAPPARPSKVKVYVRSSPKAALSWGGKPLGITPVTIERPYDSGPMDLVLRAKGFLTVRTRAYTFRSDSIYVQMTKVEDAWKILGAKKPDAPAPGTSPDGGVAPPPAQ